MKNEKGVLKIFGVGLTMFALGLSLRVGVAFADVDIKSKINLWNKEKMQEAISQINRGIDEEVMVQKSRIEEEIEAQLEALSQDLIVYTEDQKGFYKQKIEAHADDLIRKMSFSNEDDKRQVSESLEEILRDSQGAMGNLIQSYVPPELTYRPTISAPTPAPPAPPVSPVPPVLEEEEPEEEIVEADPPVEDEEVEEDPPVEDEKMILPEIEEE